MNKILAGKKIVIKKIKQPIKRIKKKITKVKRKYKNKKEYKKEIAEAKKFRRKSKGKSWNKIRYGNDDYMKLLEFSEEFTKEIARIKAKKFINIWKKSGRKIGLGLEEKYIQQEHI